MKKKKIRRATRAFYAALSYVSPRWNTKLLFLRKFGRLPELKHPQTLNEKLLKQKLERFGTDPVVRQCADKYRVRDYVDGCGCGGTLNRLLAVYDQPEDIDWDALPERFAVGQQAVSVLGPGAPDADVLAGGHFKVRYVEDRAPPPAFGKSEEDVLKFEPVHTRSLLGSAVTACGSGRPAAGAG